MRRGSLLTSPASRLTTLRPDVQVRQVGTHTHEPCGVPWGRRFSAVGHSDFERIEAGQRWAFPALEGPGCVTAVWMTVAGSLLGTVLRRRVPAHRDLWVHVTYDGAAEPAISAPMGHFFGNGSTRNVHFSSRWVGMTSGGYYSFLPMPFASSCRIEVENRHASRPVRFFYGTITWERLPEFPEHSGLLHAQYRARTFVGSGDVEGSVVPDDPHVVLAEERGPGHLVGTTLRIAPTGLFRSRLRFPYVLFPYLEGNIKLFVDDSWPPDNASRRDKPVGAARGAQIVEWTGVEDYFLSGWYYAAGPFASALHGCPVRSIITGEVSQYRFHEHDPYPWRHRALLTVAHGEFDHVDCHMESLSYYYLAPDAATSSSIGAEGVPDA